MERPSSQHALTIWGMAIRFRAYTVARRQILLPCKTLYILKGTQISNGSERTAYRNPIQLVPVISTLNLCILIGQEAF